MAEDVETKKVSPKTATEPVPDEENSIPAEIAELLEDSPEEFTKNLRVVQQTFGMMGIGHSPESDVSKKITEKHISEYLDGSREQMRNTFKARHERKVVTVILVILALVFCLGIIFLLKDTPDIMEKIIYSVSGLVAGAFGGYGFGRNHGEDE